MSVETAVWLRCDECGEVSNNSSGGGGRNVADARADARSDGWRHRAGRDLCPDCLQAGPG